MGKWTFEREVANVLTAGIIKVPKFLYFLHESDYTSNDIAVAERSLRGRLRAEV